jgi:Domain of unknown function (DUF4390)
MHFLKKQPADMSRPVRGLWLGLWAAWFCCLVAVQSFAQTSGAEIQNLKAARASQDLLVSADIKFELPASIEEAMYKGVSLTFVSELEVTRERWYWLDKTVATTSRQTRISYQALTRRWRVLPWTESGSATGLGVQLPQTYETLPEALAIAQRIYNWRVAVSGELSEGTYAMTLRYRLDISQLPKPLQIGLLGQGDWSINASTRQRFQLTEVVAP